MATRKNIPEYIEKSNFSSEELRKGIVLLNNRISDLNSALSEKWPHDSGKVESLRVKIRTTLKDVYGDRSRLCADSHGQEIESSYAYLNADESEFQSIFESSIPNAIERLKGHVELLEEKLTLDSPPKIVNSENWIWTILHPEIAELCKDKFQSGYFADSVETAFKAINVRCKKHHLRHTGNELDGAPLMQTAFSPKSPSIVVGNLSSENGKSEQLGYMSIFAGAMTGIRNPKAHDNLTITRNRAIHLLSLASLLMQKLDDAGVS